MVSAASKTLQLPFNKTVPQKSDKTKELEIKLAVAVSCHCSNMSVDHIGEYISTNGKGSALEHIR